MKAIAKINLFLEITGCRPDGYHELNNVFLPLPFLYDEVEVERRESSADEITMATEHPDIPADQRNLCWKAAELFQQKLGRPARIGITLRKHIPVAAGLGGGSSDAAAVLLELNRQAGSPFSRAELAAMAVSLGADVPFFLNPVPSLGRGVGELLEPLEMNCPLGVLLLNPGFPVSAAWAYKNWQQTPAGARSSLAEMQDAMAGTDGRNLANACFNDLEKAIFAKFPLLEIFREHFLKCGCFCCHVSGSGPTLFALCAPEQLAACAETMKQAFPSFFQASAVVSARDIMAQ